MPKAQAKKQNVNNLSTYELNSEYFAILKRKKKERLERKLRRAIVKSEKKIVFKYF